MRKPLTRQCRRSPPKAVSASGCRRWRGCFIRATTAALSKTIDGLLASAPEHYIPRLKALVCPHAGYEFSGQTAAIAYKLLAGRDVQTVVVMGPSHYALFPGGLHPQCRRLPDAAGAGADFAEGQSAGVGRAFCAGAAMPGPAAGLVAAGAQARAGRRAGHARDVGAFGRGAGALLAEGAEELPDSCRW